MRSIKDINRDLDDFEKIYKKYNPELLPSTIHVFRVLFQQNAILYYGIDEGQHYIIFARLLRSISKIEDASGNTNDTRQLRNILFRLMYDLEQKKRIKNRDGNYIPRMGFVSDKTRSACQENERHVGSKKEAPKRKIIKSTSRVMKIIEGYRYSDISVASNIMTLAIAILFSCITLVFFRDQLIERPQQKYEAISALFLIFLYNEAYLSIVELGDNTNIEKGLNVSDNIIVCVMCVLAFINGVIVFLSFNSDNTLSSMAWSIILLLLIFQIFPHILLAKIIRD
ncbi:MAG: hypothetical protein AAF296_03040 [Pseudomonadota bacterium]